MYIIVYSCYLSKATGLQAFLRTSFYLNAIIAGIQLNWDAEAYLDTTEHHRTHRTSKSVLALRNAQWKQI